MNVFGRSIRILREHGPRVFASRATNIVLRPVRVIAAEGPRSFAARSLAKASQRLTRHKPVILVSNDDAAKVDWTQPADWQANPISVQDGPVEIAWIMSPPGLESGGHQNLFRFIDLAEKAGHRCSIYLYTTSNHPVSIPEIRGMLRSAAAYPEVSASIKMYNPKAGVKAGTQAIFATGWETAYPAYLDTSNARRFYFVQDYEASFYPLGTESLLAENTYHFGFHGITAGGWLAHKLSTDFGMATDHFDFAVDKTHYSVTNLSRRSEVFFYARPVTPRRAFEFGLLALAEFARIKPDVRINLAGWDVSNWEIPFAYTNLSSLDISELNSVYNRCAAGLVMSLSNMSLLPLELLSSGVTPIVNDGPNNRMVSENPFIEYVPASPLAIARKMAEVFDHPDAVARSIAMSESVAQNDWADSGIQFMEAFERVMRG
ncbi:glycosyltransferase family 1 protein [Cryobacterium breve]|uniref:Glycosyltransferase family 1 protein n=1 Tax=Cryobacterium breve TaxID=1259258 RepID=A0ABY2JA63_9MICO|nr:glycosyltransferase family 1 protein [Cryobacterium sp. TmT3-12]TFD01844.1 glycosyltransferase family 1 protein [Cryobacterium breve]